MKVKALCDHPITQKVRLLIPACLLFISTITHAQTSTILELSKGAIPFNLLINQSGRQLHLYIAWDPSIDTTMIFHCPGRVRLEQLLAQRNLEMIYMKNQDNTHREKSIYIRPKQFVKPDTIASRIDPDTIHYMIIVSSDNGENMGATTIEILNQNRMLIADSNGVANFRSARRFLFIKLTHTGFQTRTEMLSNGGIYQFQMSHTVSWLNTAQVSGYGTGTRLTTTRNANTVEGRQLNAIAGTTFQTVLEGQVPGVLVTQPNGIPGTTAFVSIRGVSSILNGNDPLYIINNVPFSSGGRSGSSVVSGNAARSLNPVSFISLADIEKIEILKDADATAIYGSQGANGVVLITSKRWSPIQSHFSIQADQGFSKVSRRPALMGQDYFTMRHEALKNDGLTPTRDNAPDLLVLDTTQRIDWGHKILGGTAPSANMQATLSGYGRNTSYFAGINGLRETDLFIQHPAHDRVNAHFNLDQKAIKDHLDLQISGIFAWDRNRQTILDPTFLQFLPPDAPPAKDPQGRLNFPDSALYINSLSIFGQSYDAHSHNVLLNALVGYSLSHALRVELNIGGNNIDISEYSQIPISSQDPSQAPTGSSFSGHSIFSSRVIEPRLEFDQQIKGCKISLLAGTSWQWERNDYKTQSALDFTSDAFLRQPDQAPLLIPDSGRLHYGYTAWFARLNGNWKNKYILNLTGRRDGSSRFDLQHRFGNFGAAGFAWIFSNESFSHKLFPGLSLGKLRGSYGITGNDQIGDRYLQSFTPTALSPFPNIPGFYHDSRIAAGQGWETIRKLEATLELGWLKDHLRGSFTWYRHRSSNQLLSDVIPNPGDPAIFYNSPVVLENKGWEFNLTADLIYTKNTTWTININWSLPVSRIVSFPGLAQSHFNNLIVGQSPNVFQALRYTHVDPANGLYQFVDKDHNGQITDKDRMVVGKLEATAFGGLDNLLHWKNFQLECLFDARFQTAINYQTVLAAANLPGTTQTALTNTTTLLNNRWQKPGDRSAYQRLTTGFNTSAVTANANFVTSSALLTNGSFLRLRKLCLSYHLPPAIATNWRLSDATLFLNGQNLFMITPYRGADPEVQSALVLPTLRTIEIGIRLTR